MPDELTVCEVWHTPHVDFCRERDPNRTLSGDLSPHGGGQHDLGAGEPDQPVARPVGTRQRVRQSLQQIAARKGHRPLEPRPGVWPFVTMTRYVEGGRHRILEFIAVAAQAGDKSAMRWWDLFTNLHRWEQREVWFDEVCTAGHIDVSEFLGAIVRHAHRHNEDVSSVVAVSLRPARERGRGAATQGRTGFLAHQFELPPRQRARQSLARAANLNRGQMKSLPGRHVLCAMTRTLNGGRQRFLDLISLAVQSGDPTAGHWWALFAMLKPWEQRIISFDDVCAASGVHPSDLLGAMVLHAHRAGENVTILVTLAMDPIIVAKIRESALPPNPTVSVHVTANARAAAAASADPSVPSFAADMQSLQRPQESDSAKPIGASPQREGSNDAHKSFSRW
jgi:hypothetical protein